MLAWQRDLAIAQRFIQSTGSDLAISLCLVSVYLFGFDKLNNPHSGLVLFT